MTYAHQFGNRFIDVLDEGLRVACISPSGYVAIDVRHAVGFSPESLREMAEMAAAHAEACAKGVCE